MTLQTTDIQRRSATTSPLPAVNQHTEVAKLVDVSACIGCKACQAACMEWNDLRPEIGNTTGVYDNPVDLTDTAWTVMRYAEVEENGTLQWLIRKDGCMHCADPGCLRACPAPGAIVQHGNGIVEFHQENCVGCGYCVTGCPFNVPRISKKDSKAYKCTFCSDRVAVGQAPVCVKSCPTGALRFGTKEQMKDYAQTRIRDLKERGFVKAGLYDPEGVGGTHVMYVLQHADRPALYAGLPAQPGISPMVELWKGITKPLATAGMALVGLAALFHYVTKGPNEVSKDSEKEAEKEADA
ncbi:MAG: formate dehydrogenase subunit beta [Thiohalomonadaceae bacterium]